MRMIDNHSITETVLEHIILKNFWEYYILERKSYPFGDDIQYCFAMGFANEYGTCSRTEMKPYIMTQTKQLDEIMPPDEWEWVEHKNPVRIEITYDDVMKSKPYTPLEYAKDNRAKIDAVISQSSPEWGKGWTKAEKDEEREQWLWNDEGLYREALRKGVSFD